MKFRFSWKSIVESLEGAKSETFWEGDREIVRLTGPKPSRTVFIFGGVFVVCLFLLPIAIFAAQGQLFSLKNMAATALFLWMTIYIVYLSYLNLTFKQAQVILLTPEGAHRLLEDGEREFLAWDQVCDIRFPFEKSNAPFVFYLEDGREINLGFNRTTAPPIRIVTAYLNEWCGLEDFLKKAGQQVGWIKGLVLVPSGLGLGGILWKLDNNGWSDDYLIAIGILALALVAVVAYLSERIHNRKRRALFASLGGMRLKIVEQDKP